MKQKDKNLYVYTIYILLFALLIVFRMLFEGSREGGGGIWNIFQIIFVLTGLYVLIKKRQSIIINISPIKIFVVFSMYIWFLSFPYLGDFTFDTIYYFLVVPFGVMVLLTFYYLGLKNDINNSSWILLTLFYAIAYIFISKRQSSLLGIEDEVMVANSYYLLCLLPIILVFHKNKYSIIPFIVTLAVLLFSGKRAGTLAIGLMLPIYYFSFSKKTSKTIANLLSLILVFIVLNYIYSYFQTKYSLDMLSRLESMSEDGGSGRFDRWKTIINGIGNSNIFNLLFGHGYKSVAKLAGGQAHNDFLQMLYEYGFFAFILYISFYFKLLKLWLKMHRKKYPYAKNFLMSIIAALFMAMFSFFIIEPRIIICSSLCWGLFLADWRKFQINEYVVNT